MLNIGRGIEVSDSDVFEAVRAAAGTGIEPRYADKRPGELGRVSLDSSRANDALGWAAAVDFRDGVGRVVEDHRRERRRTARRS